MLTNPNPELAELVRKTPEGMAHWAGTGPAGATCGKCAHYGYWYRDRDDNSRRKQGLCELYYKRMRRHGDKTLPVGTPACKYFEAAKENGRS